MFGTRLQEDHAIIFGGPNPQHLVFTQIHYFDHNNNKKAVVGAVYSVVNKTLPSLLPTLLSPPPPAYKLRDIPGKGKGLIAIRDIALGELVIVERPVLLFPRLMDSAGTVFEFRKYAERSMNHEDWIKFNDLANVQSTYISKFSGIRNTNAFGIDLQKGMEGYSAVFLEQSRLNHSCGPNLRSTWNPYLFTLSAQAARPIRAGQELTISYVDLFSPRSERQTILQNIYKFECKCPYCVEYSPISDCRRIALMPDIAFAHFNSIYNSLIDPEREIPRRTGRQEANQLRNTLIDVLGLGITKEGIESVAAPIFYVCLMKLSGILGDKKGFKEWGFRAILSPVNFTEYGREGTYREVEQWIDWVKSPEKKFPEWGRYK